LVYAVGSNPAVEKHVGSNPTRITVGLYGFRQITAPTSNKIKNP
jgi:hypothetical protein